MVKIKLSIVKNMKNFSDIKQICKLKDEVWNYGITSQIKWFKKIVTPRDIHLLLKIDKKIIGYLLLRERKFYFKTIKNKNGNYYLFDSFIIKKEFRKKGYSNKLMIAAKKIIKDKNYFSLLTAPKKNVKYYLKNGWKITRKINALDHQDNWIKLIFNKKTDKYLNVYFKRSN